MYAGLRGILDDDGATAPPPAVGPRPADAARLRRHHVAGVRPEVLGRHHLPGARHRDAGVDHAARRARRARELVRRPARPWWSSTTRSDRPTRSWRDQWHRGLARRVRPVLGRPEVDLLSGEFFVDGARDAYRWFREHEPVFHDEANDLWGIATYDGVLAAGRDARDVLERAGKPARGRADAVDDRHGRRRPLEAPAAGERRLHPGAGAGHASRSCGRSATT